MIKKNQKRKQFGLDLGTIAVIGIFIGISIHNQTKQSEEVWAFRETLDEVYFPVEDAISACVYSNGDVEDYDCTVLGLSEQAQEAKERVTAYEVTSDDAKMLKNHVLNGVGVIQHIVETNNEEVDDNDTAALAEQISNMTDDKEKFDKAHGKIADLLNQYYE